MENKYNPELLLGYVAQYFEAQEEKNLTVTNKEIANYEIVIEIKDSAEKFRIIMRDGDTKLLGEMGFEKNHEKLEENKDNLGAVTVNRRQKTSINYPNYEEFWKYMGR